MITPAQHREQVRRRRTLGKTAIAVGILAAAVGVVALFLQVQVTVVPALDSYFCGAVIDGFVFSGEAASVCADALRGHVVAAVAGGAVAVAALFLGIVVLMRSPA